MSYTFFAHVHPIKLGFHKHFAGCLAIGIFGSALEYYESQHQVYFRNQSKLFGKEIPEGEKQPWPRLPLFYDMIGLDLDKYNDVFVTNKVKGRQ